MRTGERGSYQCEQLPEFLKYLFIQTQTKKKRIQKWIGIVVKSIKILGTVRKTIIGLKGRAAKFHKSSITFWVKAVLQPKNKQKSAVTL